MEGGGLFTHHIGSQYRKNIPTDKYGQLAAQRTMKFNLHPGVHKGLPLGYIHAAVGDRNPRASKVRTAVS